MATAVKDDRSLGELFGELSAETSTLIHQEIELARLEVTRSVGAVVRSSALMAAGAAVAYAGAIVLLIGIGWALVAAGLPTWLGFVVVGAAVVLIGAGLALWAKQSMSRVSIVPAKTVDTIRQDVEWAKEQTE